MAENKDRADYQAYLKDVQDKADYDAYLKQATPKAPDDNSSLANDAFIKTTEGLAFGARPFVAGLGGGTGAAISQFGRSDIGLLDKIKNMPEAFQRGFAQEKQGARAEEADVSARRPGMSTAIGVGTTLLTAPLLAAKGLQAAKAGGLMSGIGQSARIGAGLGATQALGHADSGGEAIEEIGKGAALGGAIQIGGNVLAKAAPAIGQAIGAGARKVGSALTGISEKEIQTYASRADQVKKLMSDAGGNISEAADQVRRGVTKDIQVTRQQLGGQIAQALDDPKYAKTLVDGSTIVKTLDDAIGKVGNVTAKFRPDELNELKNIRDLVKGSLDKKGRLDLKTLSSIKEELQAVAKPSYMNGATIFPKGDLAAKASKGAAGEARRLLNQAAPEIAQANNQLSRLHRIEELMNKNLIREGKPEAALIAAGAGNQRNAKILGAIDNITGGNAVDQAENLAAGRTFGSPHLLPVDFTGKAAARMLTGAGAGTVLGGPIGGAIGTALTSPAALKFGIDSAQFASRLAAATGRGISRALPQMPIGSTRAAILNGVERGSGEGPVVENSVNRRLRILEKGRNNKSSGQ